MIFRLHTWRWFPLDQVAAAFTFARELAKRGTLVEQYVGTKLGRASAAADADYSRTPGWWDRETFAQLMPDVKTEIDRRLAILRREQPVVSKAAPTWVRTIDACGLLLFKAAPTLSRLVLKTGSRVDESSVVW